MKKIILSLMSLVFFYKPSFATDFSNIFQATLSSHVVASDEMVSDGTNKIVFTDSIILIGKYQGDYVAALDAGFIANDNTALTSSPKTYGVHLHVVQFLAKYLTINPTYAPLLSQFEFNPRYSFDTDVHHGVMSLQIGYAHSF